jgi:hypothetical protein
MRQPTSNNRCDVSNHNYGDATNCDCYRSEKFIYFISLLVEQLFFLIILVFISHVLCLPKLTGNMFGPRANGNGWWAAR